MGATTYTGNAILNHFLRGSQASVPTGVWLALHTADPGDTGTSEVSTGNWPAYARQDLADGGAIGTAFNAASGKATTNAKEMLFPAHDGASAVTTPYYSVWSAQSGGNCLWTGKFDASKTVAPSDELKVRAGELDFSVQDGAGE